MTGKGAVLAANSRVQARPAAAKSLAGQQKLRERPQQQLQHKSLLKEAASKQQAGAKLSDRKLLQYERQGFLVTKQLLPVQQVQQVRECVQQVVQERRLEALKHRVRVLCPECKTPNNIKSSQEAMQLIQQQGDSDLGFLQFFNLHRNQHVVHQLVHHPQLTATAAQLLGANRVRLYQDCVFLKEPGYAETNWHSDLRMAPLDTNAFVTAWIPLRPIAGSESDSGLVFAVGSHRDFALPFWHDLQGRDLSDRGYDVQDTGAMSVGDVSWHHGWTLHAAAPQQPGSSQRLALAVSFFADGAKLLARRSDPSVYEHMLHDEDAESYGCWLHDMKMGAVARHAMLPVVYPRA